MIKFRFSLRTLMYVVVLMTSIVFLYLALDEIRNLRKTNTRLREQLGCLDIGDPDLVHVIELPSYIENQWRWRVYIPKEGRFVPRMACENMSSDEYPAFSWKHSISYLPTGEYTIIATLYKSVSGKWRLDLANDFGTIYTFICPTDVTDVFEKKALRHPKGHLDSVLISTYDKSNRVELVREQILPSTKSDTIEPRCFTLLIWLEPKSLYRAEPF